jgi:hypothetical protein
MSLRDKIKAQEGAGAPAADLFGRSAFSQIRFHPQVKRPTIHTFRSPRMSKQKRGL